MAVEAPLQQHLCPFPGGFRPFQAVAVQAVAAFCASVLVALWGLPDPVAFLSPWGLNSGVSRSRSPELH